MKHYTPKFFHRQLSLIIVLALCCSLLPLSIMVAGALQADYTLYFVTSSVTGENGVMYKGDPTGNSETVQPSEGVSISGNTITFTNFQFSTTAAEGLIIQGGENVQIVAVGANRIALTGTTSATARGISTQSNITFSGSGSLTVIASTSSQHSYGIHTNGKDLTFTSGTFTFVGGETTSQTSYESIGIRTNALKVSGTAKVSGSTGKSYTAIGVRTYNGINISGNGSVSGICADSYRDGNGVCVTGAAVVLSNNGSLFGSTGTAVRHAYGIRMFNGVSIGDNATITGSSGDAAQRSRGIDIEGNLTQTGGTVTGNGGISITDASHGICSNANLNISGGEITGNSGVSISGSAYGIYAAGISVSGTGAVSGNGSAADANAYGLRVTNNLTISGYGSVTGTAANANQDSNGVVVDGAAALSDSGALSGSAGDGYECFGIRIFKGVTISDNASLTGTAGNANHRSKGVDIEDNLTQSGGSVLGIGGARANARNFGVAVRGSFTQTGGSLEGISGATKEEADEIAGTTQVVDDPSSFGIFIDTITNISAGTIKGTGGYSIAHSYGIIAKGMKASGTASVYGEGGQADSNSNGIRIERSECVLSGDAIVSGKSGYGNNGYGVRVFATLTISDNAQLTGMGIDAAGSSFGVDISNNADTHTQTGGSVLGIAGVGTNGSSYGIWSSAATTLSGNATMQGRGGASTKNNNTGIYINAAVSISNTAVLQGVSGTGSTSNGVNIGNALSMSTGMVWGASATGGTAIRTGSGANITESYIISGTESTFTNPTTSSISLLQSSSAPVIISSGGSHTLQVVNGTDDTNAGPYAPGAVASITADTAAAGYEFDRWVITSGNGTFADPTSSSTTFTTGTAASVITATYRLIPDNTPPTGTITIGTGTYTTLESTVTHSTFFTQNQTVSITATDDIQTDVTIQYYLHSGDAALRLAQLEALTSWSNYTAPLSISNEGKLVVYAKLTDGAGNAAYISTNGFVLDKTAPSITGITNNQTYDQAVDFTASDTYLQSLMVNGTQQLENTFSGTSKQVSLTNNGSYTIIAADMAGNSTTVTITIHVHSISRIVAKAATCGDDGNIEHWFCSGCSKYFSDESCTTEIEQSATVIAATGLHTGGEATCHDKAECEVCHKLYGELDYSKHVGESTPATCATLALCVSCGSNFGDRDLDNHVQITHFAAKDATCGDNGNIEYWFCTDCFNYFSDASGATQIMQTATVIAATGLHTGGEATCHDKAVCTECSNSYGELDFSNHVGDITPATCGNEASCSTCGSEFGGLDPNNHVQLAHFEATDATCDSAGNTEYWFCWDCRKYFSDASGATAIEQSATVIAATGLHTGGEATCSAAAACTVCGNTYGETDPDNHTGDTEVRNAVAATETADGYTGDTYCIACNEKISDGTVIPAIGVPHEHSWGEWLNNTDSHWKSCECGELTAAESHSWGEWLNNTEGHWKSCECGALTTAESHSWGEWATTLEPTATENGSRERSCTVCGHVQTESVLPIPQTSDSSTPISAFILLMIISAGGVFITLKIRRITLER